MLNKHHTQIIHVLLLLVLAFGALPASAQTPQKGDWIADSTTGCKVWNPAPEPKETIAWSGACADGFAHGQGVVQWFKDGQANGHFEGEYVDGRRNGHGVSTWADRSRYDGDFSDDKQAGRGVYTWAKGDRYEGDFSDDKQAGRGVFTWAKGGRYEGEWRDNKPNGKGKMTTADGKTYVGTWKSGCYEKETFRLFLFSLKQEFCIGS